MDKQKTNIATVGVRVEKIDSLSTLIKIIISILIMILISICAIGTAYLIVSIDSNLDDLTKLLIILAAEACWITILFKVVLYKKSLTYVDIQMDKNGNVGFKHNNKTIRFNIANEHKKNNLKILLHKKSDTIIIIVPNLNKQYKIEVFSSQGLKSEIQNISVKFNIPIKDVEE